ncbi:hypothetical protein ACRAWF_28975 [Streptomyces sp. L7]
MIGAIVRTTPGASRNAHIAGMTSTPAPNMAMGVPFRESRLSGGLTEASSTSALITKVIRQQQRTNGVLLQPGQIAFAS